jgi:hypothetical protein
MRAFVLAVGAAGAFVPLALVYVFDAAWWAVLGFQAGCLLMLLGINIHARQGRRG